MSWKDIEEMVRTKQFHGIDKGKYMKKYLEKQGFGVVKGGGKGSHWKMAKAVGDEVIVTTVPKGSIQVGLLKAILRQARII